MKRRLLNTWLTAAAVAVLYDGFYFVLLNLINPQGNQWTVSEFVILVAKSLISIGTIYSSYFISQKYLVRLSLGLRLALMLLMSIPVFCVTYLPFWVLLIRKGIYGLTTDSAVYAGQLASSVYGLHIPIGVIIIIFLYSRHTYQTELRLIKTQNLATETELRNLQQQIDPHFLFNSLNILSALIRLDTEKSARFTQKLSEVYRFLLKTGKESVISVEEELSFVADYFYLVQCRFGTAFELEIVTKEKADIGHLYIVPGSLQLLVENVIKHNRADEQHPILIGVVINEDQLTVTNRIAKKESNTSGYGLSSLAMRYQLLNSNQMVVDETEESFCVFIPLLKNLAHA